MIRLTPSMPGLLPERERVVDLLRRADQPRMTLRDQLPEITHSRLPVRIALAQPFDVAAPAIGLDVLQQGLQRQRPVIILRHPEIGMGQDPIDADIGIELGLLAPSLLFGAAGPKGSWERRSAKRKPPPDPLSFSMIFRTLACGLK